MSPPPDLRLTAFAVGVWLSALLALHLSAPVAAGVAGGAGAVAAVALTWWPGAGRGPISPSGRRHGVSASVGRGAVSGLRPFSASGRRAAVSASVGRGAVSGWRGGGLRVGAVGRVAVAVLLGAGLGAAVTAARLAERDADPIRDLAAAHATVRVRLVVSDDPRAINGRPGRRATYLLPARLRLMWTDEVRVRARARVLVLAGNAGWRGLLPGQVVETRGRLQPSRGGDLRAAVLSVDDPPRTLGRPPLAQRMAGRLRAGLQTACEPLPDAAGGLLPGLVVGDTSRLDPAVEADFRTTGLTHLTAVSGANCAIVVGAILLFVRAARAGPRTAAVLSMLALAGFVVLARPSPSVLRAAAMGAVALIALASGRPRAALPALGAAVVVLVVVDPELAGSPGFALSALATSGLLLLAPRWRDALRRRGVPAGVAEALAVPAAAQVACGPLVTGLSGTVSIVAVPANLLAGPAVAPATVLGVFAAVVSPVWAGGAEFLAWLGSWPARWLVLVARHGAEVPSGAVPWPGGAWGGVLLGAVTVGLFLLGRWPVVRRLSVVVGLAAAVAALPVRVLTTGWPPPSWLAVACDVGQGDALVLAAGRDSGIVVDAGPDPAAVDRCLRRLGVRSVPVLVISHFHADHVGGVAGVFRGRAVASVVTPEHAEPATARAAVVATAAGTPVTPTGAGWAASAGRLRMVALTPAEPLRGTRSDVNNNSLILRVESAGYVFLLAGDAETEEQDALLARYGPDALHADVLKVAHHGSAFQEPAFLGAVDPSAALVSVAARNDYGHPNPGVLAHIAAGGARVMRTDRDGDIAVVVAGGGRLAVVARGLDPGRRR